MALAVALSHPGAAVAAGPAAVRDTAWFAPFAVTPLAPPLVVTGGFGERRPRHFHAGLDFSTGDAIGHPVRAPIDGWIERVHTQGNGYGRSVYLHGRDGRLVVFGHLDALAEPLASYLQAVQDSTGRFDQDLWPERERFAVRAGDLVAWSGVSGTTVPHLHIEVRRGDMALNPQLAGLPVRVPLAPQIRAVTLEPLDGSSWVERGSSPLTLSLALERAETLLVEGRVRAMVRAEQPGERGARLAPWRLRETWEGAWIEWRADSESWASDMDDVDYVYDVGRAAPPGAPFIQMWAPRGWRPRVLRTSIADSLEAGLIEVKPEDPARALRLDVEDVTGRTASRVVWLRGPRSGELGPAPHGTGRFERPPPRHRGPSPRPAGVPGRFELAALPGGALRLMFRGAPSGARDVTIDDLVATRRDGVWSVVINRERLGPSLGRAISGRLASGDAWRDSAASLELQRVGETGGHGSGGAARWRMERRALFEPATVAFAAGPRPAAGNRELEPIGASFELGPATMPLRSGAVIRLAADAGWGLEAGAYGDFGEGWEWLGGPESGDSTAVGGESRRLGWFAAFADTMAPRVRMLRTPRRRAPGPYSTWSLRARVTEEGSGLDSRQSFFRVDGRRVPTDWDEPRDLLVWRPLAPPATGTHHYELEVRDHAGNLRHVAGTFVLD